VPQRVSIGSLAEAQNLFDSSVAVGRHDQNWTRQSGKLRIDTNNGVMVELALLPVVEEFITIRDST
jgi:hypothetical protein